MPKSDPENSPSPATASPTPAPVVPPPLAIPDELMRAPTDPRPPTADVPTIPQLDDSFKAGPRGPAATELQMNVEWRKLRNRLQNDAQLKAALARAEAAPNDLEKRRLLANYYDVYYGRMIALAATPELKKFVAQRKAESLASLKQPKVRPERALRLTDGQSATQKSAGQSTTETTPMPSAAPTPAATFPSVFSTPSPVRP